MATPPVVHYIAAESDPAKRSLLQQRPPQRPLLAHLFGDIRGLTGPCWDHLEQRYVTIDSMDLMVAGFPCVDVSPLKFNQVPFRADAVGATANVFHALLPLVDAWQPSVILLENVLGVLKRRKVDNDECPWHTMSIGLCLSISCGG